MISSSTVAGGRPRPDCWQHFAFYGFWWLGRTLAFSSFSVGVTALMQLPQLMLVWNCKVFIKLEKGGTQGGRV